jgi:hypothetical protein
MVRKRRMKDFSLMGTRLCHVPMTNFSISNKFLHYHISSEKILSRGKAIFQRALSMIEAWTKPFSTGADQHIRKRWNS